MRNYVDPNLNNFTENCHKKLMKILKHWKAKFSILVLGFKFKMFFLMIFLTIMDYVQNVFYAEDV